MNLLDAGTKISKTIDVACHNITWAKVVTGLDARKHGGWRFMGGFLDLRAHKGLKTPAMVICCASDYVKVDSGSSIKEIHQYYLLRVGSDGVFSLVANASSDKSSWSDIFFPFLLSFFQVESDDQSADIKVSGEALKDAKWLQSHMEDGSTIEDTVDFALKFAKIVWERGRWQDSTMQSEQKTGLESQKSDTLTETEQSID